MLGRQLPIVATSTLSPEDAQLARAGLDWYLTRFGFDARQFAAARYQFDLTDLREYWADKTFRWAVIPHGGVAIESRFGSKAKRYAMPHDTIEAVPDDPRSAFRGMAWEEWQAIRQQGYIESSGAHNLDQPNLTFFGDASQATHYASGFAPLPYTPGARRPGVVIQIPREYTLGPEDLPSLIPQGERAVQGRAPIGVIQAVWLLIPYQIRYGMVEIIATVDIRGAVAFAEGSRSSPGAWYRILPLTS